PLPCDFASNQAARTALVAYTTPHVTTQYCVYSSQHENLGCYTTQAAAAQRQRETGQQALLNLIGKTARLEERPTLGVVAPADPPTHSQIAIAVDRTVISNPQVQSAITAGNGIITGNFTEQEAKDLASLLNAGALPVELTRQSVRTVSPTLGSESLKQGIIAGIAGLILLFIYLLLYYRLLGIVAWFGMSIWAILALALISIAGKSYGYTLSLAGVAGLVISLGVTADS